VFGSQRAGAQIGSTRPSQECGRSPEGAAGAAAFHYRDTVEGNVVCTALLFRRIRTFWRTDREAVQNRERVEVPLMANLERKDGSVPGLHDHCAADAANMADLFQDISPIPEKKERRRGGRAWRGSMERRKRKNPLLRARHRQNQMVMKRVDSSHVIYEIGARR